MGFEPRTSGLKGQVPYETDYKKLKASDKNTWTKSQNGLVDSNFKPGT